MNVWVKGLLNSVMTGVATAGGSAMAMTAAKVGGFTVPELNLKAFLIVLIAGGLSNAFSYLRTSPMFQSQTTTTTTTVEKEGTPKI